MSFAAHRTLITGAHGFLGRHLLSHVKPAAAVAVPSREECDLCDGPAVRTMLRAVRPTLIIHAAAFSGGLAANRAQPARFFYDNLAMGMNLIEGLRAEGLANTCAFVQVGTMCSYPADAPQPYREEDLFAGPPDPDIASYGIAKRALMQILEAYRLQHGLRGIMVIPSNLYGPGDTFDPQRSHAVGAMVKRFIDAARDNAPEVVCWGTGNPTRDFLYVADAASGISAAACWALTLPPDQPVQAINLGSGQERSIRDLADAVSSAAGFTGRTTWDPSKPDGVPRRVLDITRAKALLGWSPATPLAEGLKRAVAWYRTTPGGASGA